MRPSRLLIPLVAGGALLAATIAPAQAATPGIGTTTGTLSVVSADVGSLLSLDLLTDRAESNTNPDLGVPSAAAQLQALSITSEAAGVSQEIPLLATSSTGAKAQESQGVTPVANPALSGTILPVDLSAIVDANGASSGLSAGLGSLDLLGGVANISATTVGMTANALTQEANGTRGVDIDAITVLDLESLLAGLGIALPDLSANQVLGLLDQLDQLDDLIAALDALGLDVLDGVTFEDLTDLQLTVEVVNDQITDLSGAIVALGDAICDEADPGIEVLSLLLDELPVDLCADIPGTLAAAATALTGLTSDLAAILDTALDTLGLASLLAVDGVDASIVTKATDSLDTSAAAITATLGAITVGDLSIPGVSLTDVADTVNQTINTAESAVGSVLAVIDPSLANLVDIAILEQATSVEVVDGAIVSDASLNALTVRILPDAGQLLGIITDLAAGDSIGEQLTTLGAPVPGLPAGIDQLNQSLAGLPTSGIANTSAVMALSEGATIQVASFSQRSAFAPDTAELGAPTTSLPKTGSQDTLLLLFGAAAVVGGLTLRRGMRSTAG